MRCLGELSAKREELSVASATWVSVSRYVSGPSPSPLSSLTYASPVLPTALVAGFLAMVAYLCLNAACSSSVTWRIRSLFSLSKMHFRLSAGLTGNFNACVGGVATVQAGWTFSLPS